MATLDKHSGWVLPLFGILSILALWAGLIYGFGVQRFVAPSPAGVASAIWENRTLLWNNISVTAGEAIAGFFLGNAIAIVLATIFVHSQLVNRMYFPVVVIFHTIPIVALSPVLILIFGLSPLSKVMVAAIICLFPTLVNMVRGLQSTTLSELELMSILSASKAEVFFKLRVPKSLPFLFAALKIACTTSVIGAIVSEWIGAERGIGMLIIQSTFEYRTELLYASIATSSALALCLFGIVSLIERFAIRWRTG